MNHFKLVISILFFSILFPINTRAQEIFQTKSFRNPDFISPSLFTNSFSIDLDNDNDIDFITYNSGQLVWYEKIDAVGKFNHVDVLIDSVFFRDVDVMDYDNDGDYDFFGVLAGPNNTNFELVWYENLDSGNTLSEPMQILFSPTKISDFSFVDMNSDGFKDLVIIFETELIWYYNNGINFDLSSSDKILFESSNFGVNFKFVDIEGDGDIDIIGPNRGTYFLNSDGNGLYQKESLSLTNQIASPIPADFDGDGDLDILSSNFGLYWFEKTDTSNYFVNSRAILTQDKFATGTKIIDFDNDGDLDILTYLVNQYYANYELVYIENIDARRNKWEVKKLLEFPEPVGIRSGYLITLLDFDKDSDIDFIASFGYEPGIIFENLLERDSFHINTSLRTNNYGIDSDVRFLDFENDGDIDIIFGGENFFENRGNEKFLSSGHFQKADRFYNKDFNNDGYDDFLYTLNDSIFLKENLGKLSLPFEKKLISTRHKYNSPITILDYDGDGDFDFLAQLFSQIYLFENIDGKGNFVKGEEAIISGINTLDIVVFDKDLDGDLDFAITDYREENSTFNGFDFLIGYRVDGVTIFENNGLGNYQQESLTIDIESKKFDRYVFQDIDEDGDLDLTFIEQESSNILFYENNGNNELSQGITLLSIEGSLTSFSSPSYSDVKYNDIDRDGDLDLFINQKIDNDFYTSFFERLSDNTFAPVKFIKRQSGREGIKFFDLDQDGYDDLFINSRSGNWYQNILNFNSIEGQINFDFDQNGCDADDIKVEEIQVNIESNNLIENTFTDSDGFYKFYVKKGDYTVKTFSDLPSFIDVDPTSSNTIFTGEKEIDYVDFCLSSNAIKSDIEVSILPLTDARPGFDAEYLVYCENAGSQKEKGILKFEFDKDIFEFISSDVIPNNQTDSFLEFEYDLLPFNKSKFKIEFSVFPPPTVDIDREFTFTASANLNNQDCDEEDNIAIFESTTIGSYDPNDIRVTQGSRVLIDDKNNYLDYIIRFQNTGTADAINVRVENLLDDKLDISTMKMIDVSHNYRVEIDENRKASFYFDNIFLPDSTANEVLSHGYIAYKIKPNKNIRIGDIISNEADIYFDFNLPVETNRVDTKIVDVTSVKNQEYSDFEIYPIPAKDFIFIKGDDKIKAVEIFNTQGKLLNRYFAENRIPINNLWNGIYYCRITNSNDDIEIIKFIIQR